MRQGWLWGVMLMGCNGSGGVVSLGQLDVCLSDGAQESDLSMDITGEVVAMDSGDTACAHTLTVVDVDKVSHTVGFSVVDGSGVDVFSGWPLAVGDTITASMRRKMVFGSVEGLVIEDAYGMVLAADEGTWGGALTDETDLGVQAEFGSTAIHTTQTECITTEIFEVVFSADDALSLIPFSSGEITVDGALLTAWAVDAHQLGPGTNCEVSDQTDTLAWVVLR